MNKWLNELAQVINFNPEWTIEEIKADQSIVSVDIDKATHIVKRYLNEEFPAYAEEITKNTGDTLYKALRGSEKDYCRMSLASSLMLIKGTLSIEDYMALFRKDWAAKKFPYPMDAGKIFVDTAREICGELYSLKGTPVEPEVAAEAGAFTLPKIDSDGVQRAVDSLLASATKGTTVTYERIKKELDDKATSEATLKNNIKSLKKENTLTKKELSVLKQAVADLTTKSLTSAAVSVPHSGDIPAGNVKTQLASEVFGMPFKKDFEVPVWTWDSEEGHPHVPQKDPNYIFRPVDLQRVLYAILTNQRMYLHGHTGTGKTTLIEQVAAYLNWPFVRINFDSEITRMDLIGRDTLTTDADGKTISKFVDGILPSVMSGPYISCFDELDFVRPDVAYVMQSALEGNQLRITEDGDRIVKPHPMYRMFGTGNTVGQGDEHGMYAGARPQSLAFLDRFTVWLKVDYLNKDQRQALIVGHFPSLNEVEVGQITKYSDEHLEAFTSAKLIQPLSPRGMLAIARATVILGDVKEAITMTVLDRANGDDKAVLRGIVDRVCK